MKVYLVYEGMYGRDGTLTMVFTDKKKCLNYIKSQPFTYKYNKQNNYYLCEEISMWLRIDIKTIN